MVGIKKVCVLVDWHNVERVVIETHSVSPQRYIPQAILRIQDEVSALLTKRDSTVRYRALLRVYHGWHCRDQPTPLRVQFEKVFSQKDFSRTIGRVSFASEIRFGNELACDTNRNPLYDTNRSQGQKMVDTAISCDLLYLLRNNIASIGIIVSDDDDFVPAAFTAEAWGLEAVLLRSPERTFEEVSKAPAGDLLCHWRQ